MLHSVINISDSNIFTIIYKLKSPNISLCINSIHSLIIKIHNFQDTFNNAIVTGKTVNKVNCNKDLYWLNEDVADVAIETTVSKSSPTINFVLFTKCQE